MNAPLFAIAIPFLSGIFLGDLLRPAFELVAVFQIVLLCLFLCINRRFRRNNLVLTPGTTILLLCAGMLSYSTASRKVIDFSDLDTLGRNRIVEVQGTVEKVERRGEERATVTLFCKKLGSARGDYRVFRRKVLVLTKGVGDLPGRGDELVASGRMIFPSGLRNPGGFDYRRYLMTQDISFLVDTRKEGGFLQIMGRGNDYDMLRLTEGLRTVLQCGIRQHLAGRTCALLEGLLLGVREDISKETQDLFRHAGISHILAVSGLHVGIIAGIILFLMGMTRLPARIGYMLTGLLILLYVPLTGSRDSVIRASIMAVVILGSRILERPANIYNTIGAAALIALIHSPLSLFHAGFQLSFLATLSIVSFHRLLNPLLTRHAFRRSKAYRYVLTSLLVTVSAQIGTTPIILYHFGFISLWAPLVNLVVLPITGILVTSGFLGMISHPLSGLLAHYFFASAWFLAEAIFRISAFFAAIPLGHVQLKLSAWEISASYMLIMIILNWRYFFETPRRRLVVAVSIILLLVPCLFIPEDQLRVTILDVGQGDAILVEIPDGPRYLIDSGTSYTGWDTGEDTILPFFLHRRVDSLDGLILTHPHWDHIGGMYSLIGRVRVSDLYFAPSCDPGNRMRQLVCRADSAGVLATPLFRGDYIYREGTVQLQCLHPVRGKEEEEDASRTEPGVVEDDEWFGPATLYMSDNPNNNSLVLKLVYGEVGMLFTGDIEREVEEVLVEGSSAFPLEAQVLKVPHHGSRTSSSIGFLHAVEPEVAVISVGKRNRFGHPSPEVLERYRAREIRIFRTDRDGAIVITSDGKRYNVSKTIRQR